ncbi:MAG: glycosyltransferase family 39 protein, partial [Candidatus Aminicenantales bacterium]
MISNCNFRNLISKSKRNGFIIVIFLLILASRLVNLGADPPVNLSPSGGLFGDESALAHNARNKILFGQWMSDDWNPIVYNPILNILEYLSFSLLGVGLRQLRLVNVVSIAISFLLFWTVLKRNSGRRVAVMSVLLLGFNYVFAMYNRLGLNDTFLVLPMALTLFFWQEGLVKPRLLFLAGISSFACYITKASALYFVLAALAALIFALGQKYATEKNMKRILSSLGFYLGGLVISYLVWFLFFYSPYKTEFARASRSWFGLAMPSNIGKFWLNLTSFTFPGYLVNAPVELIIAWCYIPLVVYGLVKWRNKLKPLEVFVFLWLSGGYVALNGLSYRPPRYFVPIIPALCFLSAFALDRIWNVTGQKKIRINRATLFMGLVFGLFYAAWVMILFRRCISLPRVLKIVLPVMGLAVLLALLSMIVRRIQKKALIGGRRDALKIFLRAAVVSLVAFS